MVIRETKNHLVVLMPFTMGTEDPKMILNPLGSVILGMLVVVSEKCLRAQKTARQIWVNEDLLVNGDYIAVVVKSLPLSLADKLDF